MSRDKARAIRRTFTQQFQALADRLRESQSDRYPEAYRREQAAAILKEMTLLETTLSHDLTLWRHGQQVEAARLRAADPVLTPEQETRRLREQMEARDLAEQNPSRAQGQNILLPEAWRLLNGGNLDRAQVYADAAKRVGALDGNLSREIDRLRNATVPALKQAREIEVMAADEIELARRDVAALRLSNKVGSDTDQVRASTALKMADFKRAREAVVLKQEEGIDLPTATEA